MGKVFARSYLVFLTTLLLLISLSPNCHTATVAPTTRSTTPKSNESNGSGLPTSTVKQQENNDTSAPVTTSTLSAGLTKISAVSSSTGTASSTGLTTKTTAEAGTSKVNLTTTQSPQTFASTGATSPANTSSSSMPGSTTVSALISSTASSLVTTTKNGSSGSTSSTQAATTTTMNKTASTSTVAPTTSSATTTIPMTSSSTASIHSPSTAAPVTTTNASDVTNSPKTTVVTGSTSQAVTTSAPSTVGSTSTPLVTTSQTSSVSSTASPTSTPSSTVNSSQTSASTINPTSTQSSTVKPSTASPSNQLVYISEILMDKTGIFQTIEIQLSDQLNLNHYAIVLVNGETNKTHRVIYLNSSGLPVVNDNLREFQFNSNLTLPTKGIGIAIYDTNLINISEGKRITQGWEINTQGVVDALVIGKTYAGISTSLIDTLTPGVNPFILDPSKYGKNMTISRCSTDYLRSTEMYALIHASMGELNNKGCRDRQAFHSTLSLKIKKLNCGVLKTADNKTSTDIMHEVMKLIVKEVNKRCQCGFTRMHIIDPVVQCCVGTAIEMKFVAPNKVQDDEFTKSYKSFIQNASSIPIGTEAFDLDQSCLTDCCKRVIQPITKADSSRNVKVSVAVIVTLLVLFIIIVLVVYMYMRKKKYAVQQFRMSKLEEDEEDFDDMTVGFHTDDTDEFVGGQEATFDRRA